MRTQTKLEAAPLAYASVELPWWLLNRRHPKQVQEVSNLFQCRGTGWRSSKACGKARSKRQQGRAAISWRRHLGPRTLKTSRRCAPAQTLWHVQVIPCRTTCVPRHALSAICVSSHVSPWSSRAGRRQQHAAAAAAAVDGHRHPEWQHAEGGTAGLSAAHNCFGCCGCSRCHAPGSCR